MGRRRLRPWLALLLTPLAPPLLYLLAALAGALPLSGGRVAEGPATATVFVVSNGAHVDILVPLRTPAMDWSDWLRPEDFPEGNPFLAAYVGFGWGDRDFYLNTPRWSDLTPAAALRALFASRGSLVHATLWYGTPMPGDAVRSLRLDAAAHARLVAGLKAGFATDEKGRPRPIPGRRYGPSDAFYEGVGRYSLVLTCNEWAGRRLRDAGVRLGWWTPLPFGLMWSL
ncbi:TIGR02117 family protein [Zavarzinia aquatilis]|uniref:TIGR02117 family protein n=1 Tax=Zavarzinia aquatilis TaxID=2211142 RepID=UPI001402F564|nr:TIGR02117 family protein [Zavarzinia aquatilis]